MYSMLVDTCTCEISILPVVALQHRYVAAIGLHAVRDLESRHLKREYPPTLNL